MIRQLFLYHRTVSGKICALSHNVRVLSSSLTALVKNKVFVNPFEVKERSKCMFVNVTIKFKDIFTNTDRFLQISMYNSYGEYR